MSKSLPVPVDGKNGFDLRPVKLAGFTLSARAATPVGRPTLEQWEHAFWFASATEEAADYWVGDLLLYSEGRDDWREKIDQAMSVTGLAKHTLENKLYVSRHVGEPIRQIAPTPAHAAEVAKLPPKQQATWMTTARTEGWTVRELRQKIRSTDPPAAVDGAVKTPDALEQFLADRHITTLWPRDVAALRKFIEAQTTPTVDTETLATAVRLVERAVVWDQADEVAAGDTTLLIEDFVSFVRDWLAEAGR